MRAADTGRLVALAAIWGASFIFMRVAAPVLGAAWTAELRVLLGGLSLLAWFRLAGFDPGLRSHWRSYLVVGAIGIAAPFALYSFAAMHAPASLLAIVNATAPIFGLAWGALFRDERFTGRKAAGLALGVAGVALIARPAGLAESRAPRQAEARRGGVHDREQRRRRVHRRERIQRERRGDADRADDEVRAPMDAQPRIEAPDAQPGEERKAPEEHAQLRGPHGPEDRRGDAHEDERSAPDRGERHQAAVIGRPHLRARFSISRSFFFRARPQAYPPRVPSVRSARWHGMTSATGFAPQALPTARTARGAPMARAIWP